MERRPARSPQDSSFLRTPSTHTFVTYSTSSTLNLASTYGEWPRVAIGNSSKCHLHEVRRYSRRVLPFVSPIRSPGVLLRVLRLAIAKRPVLLLHLHQADESVLATKPLCFVE